MVFYLGLEQGGNQVQLSARLVVIYSFTQKRRWGEARGERGEGRGERGEGRGERGEGRGERGEGREGRGERGGERERGERGGEREGEEKKRGRREGRGVVVRSSEVG